MRTSRWFRMTVGMAALTLLLGGAGRGWAGSIFLTGHDPDFHALEGGNATGAANINHAAINFITDAAFNPFTAAGVHKFLFVESSISPPGGHVNGVNGIIASGYVAGTDFDFSDASTLNAKLNQLGTTYNAIVIASDFGGVLTQAELDILNARRSDIINFLNAGGGLYAMAESGGTGNPFGLTTHDDFGFLPIVTTSAALNQTEIGNTVTAFGLSLGLTDNDINGNASHNIFTSTGGLNIVDRDSSGDILSLAGRQQIVLAVPEPATFTLAVLGLGGLAGYNGRRRMRTAVGP